MPKKRFEFPEPSEWESHWRSAVVETESDNESTEKQMSTVMAWLPYGIIAVILVLTRLPQTGLMNILNVNRAPFAIIIRNILGQQGVDWVFKWAWSPGIIPFTLVAFLIIPLHRMKAGQVKAAWKETGQMVSGAAIALMFGIAMVQLFRFSFVNSSGLDSMLLEMAEGLAALAGKAYIVVAPLIGVVGAFISGSATVSTTLFA